MSTNTNNRPKAGSNNAATAATPKAPAATGGGAWSTPNAWSRPLQTGPPPGLAPPGTPLHLRERFLHLSLTLVGQRVTLTQDDGTVLEGVFHTATPFGDLPSDKKNMYVLKAVLVVKGDTDKIPNGSTVVVPMTKVTSLHCKSLRLGTVATNGKGEGFRTDVEISSAQTDKSRELVSAGSAWTAAGNSRAEGLNEGPPPAARRALKGNIGEWDQFRANEELFNVQAKFDENLYTTELDKSAMDSGKIKAAERMAREIETTTSSNIHVAEERGQVIGGDFDEEDRYSGVLTNNLEARNKDGAPAPKKMNYAAAAAKADAAKAGPPGFAGGKKEDAKAKKDDKKTNAKKKAGKDEEKTEATEKPDEDAGKQEEKKTSDADDSKLNKEEAKKETSKETATKAKDAAEEPKKAAAKLNANAKSFSFNPTAKTFTPSFGTPAPAAPEAPQMLDPNTGLPVQQIPGQPHYVQHPMGQPGMMPIMNPHFAMRFPGGYPGMEQPPPGQQPQHMQHPQMHQQQAHEGGAPAPGGNEQQQTGDSAAPHQPQQQQPPPPQHPGVPVPYPPNAYYPGGMPMQHRGPGGPHMAYQQMVGQQIPVPGGNPYQHMYGMRPPPPMRGPNGAPYYPNAAPHYPQYMVGEDDYRGGGRGGRGAGRRGRGGRKGGRGGGGRGYWQNNPREQGAQHNGGRHGGGHHAPPPAAVVDATPPPSKEEPTSAE